MAEPYYITTAIAYPNGRPHIGHAYEAIAADVIARFQRQQGRCVRFQTGTDEHGLKMAQKAREMGVAPDQLSEEMSLHFIAMCKVLNISYDVFQRTSAPAHHAASQELWRRMAANGDLYLGRYEGWYSVRDEAYYEAAELLEGEAGTRLSPQGTPVEWTVEESWFFRLSRYQEPLLALLAAQPEFLQPDSRRNEVIRFIEGGLRDLSVSRTSFDWGVRVPGNDRHVMYVWVDALTNYLTGLGFPEETEAMATWWPADLHLIGKDIVRFHAVYWPAFLMSAGLPLPKCVFGHGFLLHRGEKMSKSLGNVVDPVELVARFGVDSLRYFLMRDVSFGQDGSISAEAIVTRCNAELANSFGNLAQRVLSQIFKNLAGGLPEEGELTAFDRELLDNLRSILTGAVRRAMTELNFSAAIELWMSQVFACNQYVDGQAPWALKKQGDLVRMESVLAVLFQCIRDLAIAIRPVIPASADRLLDQMGIAVGAHDHAALVEEGWYARLCATGWRMAQPTGIFPRLELPALAEH